MNVFLKFLSPFRAVRDLRGFLARRKPQELLFALPALVLTGLVVTAFYLDTRTEVPYRRNIIYVESWPLTRSDAEIRAQQKIDQAKKEQDAAEVAKQEKEKQRQFKKIDDALRAYGI